jgi:hypothetical protein
MLESRSPFTSQLGKLTAELKAKVSEDTKEAFEQEARKAGMTASELLREMIIVRAHGVDTLRSLYEHRISVVSGVGPEKAT